MRDKVRFSLRSSDYYTAKAASACPALAAGPSTPSAGGVVDRHHVDGQPAQRGFLVLVVHVRARLAHGLDDGVEADEVGAVAFQGQRGGRDGLDGAHAIALDAGDLHQAADGIAGHAQVVLDADFGGVFNLLVATAQRRHQAGGGHRAGHAHFALAADFGAGDGSVLLAQHADGGRRQHEVAHALDGVRGAAVFRVVAQHGRDDAGGAVGGRRDHPPAGGVFLVDGHGVQADLVDRVVRQAVAALVHVFRFLGLAPQVGGAALDVQAAWQLARGDQAMGDTVVHDVPDAVQARIKLLIAHICRLILAQHLRDGLAGGAAVFQQMGHGVEGVRHGTATARALARLRLAGGVNEAAADRVKHPFDHAAVLELEGEAHAVRVFGQGGTLVPDDARLRTEWHRLHAQQTQLAVQLHFGQHVVDPVGIDVLGRLAHQAENDRLVGGVADAGQRERAIQRHFHADGGVQRTRFEQEAACRHHGADRVRTGRPDADLEKIQYAHVHICLSPYCWYFYRYSANVRGQAPGTLSTWRSGALIDVDVGQHVGHHLLDADARLPAPVGRGGAVVQALRPGGGDRLAAVGGVGDFKAGPHPGNRRRQLAGIERDPRHIVGRADFHLVRRGVHQFDGGADGVGHVNHWQRRLGFQEAAIGLVLEGCVEDGDGVIGGAAARRRLVADDAGVADRAHVHAVLGVVVLAQALAGQFADAVDGGGVHHRVLGRVHRRGIGAECGNRRGPEHLERFARFAALARHFQDVEEAVHVQGPGFQGRLLAGGGQQRGQLIHLGDVVLGHQGRQGGLVQHVEAGVALGVVDVVFSDVGVDDVLGAVLGGQGADQFTADLAVGADDEDAFHACCLFSYL